MSGPRQVVFVEMMGEPGSYDATVYDHFEDKDNEGLWFQKRFGHVPGIALSTCNVCIGEELPGPDAIDGVVLAGSYNSVHDDTGWQREMRQWLPCVRAVNLPVLAICGSHQLLAHCEGAGVEVLSDGPYAGTFAVDLTEAGVASPLFEGIRDGACFQFANTEHVTAVPPGSILLASSGRVPVAALDFGNHCYSTQFHPEGTHETLGTVWRNKAPHLMNNYRDRDDGGRLVENFLNFVAAL